MTAETRPESVVPEVGPSPTVRRAGRSLRMAWRIAYVRLRFLAVIGVAFVVVAEWDVLRNYWDKLTRPGGGPDTATQPVSPDTEYFCPMDPGVLSDWPSKCPVCNMTLVRRKRGDASPLPDGVVARMQFSPYRLQLAGIRTSPIDFQPLAREVEAVGEVRSDDRSASNKIHIEFGLPPEDSSTVEGLDAEVMSLSRAEAAPLRGAVRSVRSEAAGARADLEVDDTHRHLRPGERVRVRLRIPIARSEPFRTMAVAPPPLRPGEPRRAYRCPEHAEVVREAPGRCPIDRTELTRINLAPNQRVGWWCPMHPDVTADRPGRECRACGGMALVPRVVTYGPPGKVLAVPESAVVDTGTRAVVYVEKMPGMFDGVEVTLGPRCGDAYPVIRGLEPGQRVATAGSFLIDAETRLNPSVAAAYFGAGARSPTVEPETKAAAPDDGLSSADRAQVAAQKICPVTGKPLGSMGTPTRFVIRGRAVFLCCEGCEPKLKADPEKYLAKFAPGGGREGPDPKPRP
jgi:hypothetical protein